MKTYVAMLRGINVGGHHKVAMSQLRDVITALGHDDVTTYIQSGNAVFRTDVPAAKVAPAMATALAREFGFEIPVVLRTPKELAAVIAANPFPRARDDRLQVSFLATPLAKSLVGDLEDIDLPPEQLSVRAGAREIYSHCPNGFGRSPLGTAVTKRLGKAVATARNWRTVTKLLDLSRNAAP